MAVQSHGLPIEKQFITYDMNEVKEYWATDATALKAFAAGNDLRNRDKDYSTVGENAVYINVWAYEPGWTVSVTENGTFFSFASFARIPSTARVISSGSACIGPSSRWIKAVKYA